MGTPLSPAHLIVVWLSAALAIAGILFRPARWPEALWACAGAALLVVLGPVSASETLHAAGRGTDVYLFLTGMMLLSELARRNGFFDWLAAFAVRAARQSRTRLFALIYAAGILVTVFLSNDATAVVLTPAVYAAVKRARADALPYLFICAFIANAASFVLPISNPANLVVYGKLMPPLAAWLRVFLFPSVVSIAVTYFLLRAALRSRLRGETAAPGDLPRLSRDGRIAAWGIAAAALVLVAASAKGLDLGLPTLFTALAATLVITRLRPRELRETAADISWSVLPLVAGLFVIVEGLNRAGAVAQVGYLFDACARLAPIPAALAASFGIAALSNVMNNLPSGLLAGNALQSAAAAHTVRNAVLLGVDLGPNLSVTGSLATVLWLIALRREGVRVGAWEFFKLGAIVMPPALFCAALALVA